ncbi:MAG: ABC transporter permease subunit [Candidatus Omnitrophica bacterium]|nr:ABC transporter permease subunit [Candidatus Omnitrophota bacterium]
MPKVIAITKKELAAYFKSPVAYIILVVTLVIFNFLFFMIIDQNREATLRDVFQAMEFIFLFIVPLLTMKVFAEEKNAGTMEFLMTTPTNNNVIVFGKYLGTLLFLSVLLLISVVYYGIIEFYAAPDWAATLSGFLGIWLEAALFLAIGMMTSSWTKSQVVAAITSYVILFFLYFSLTFVKYFTGSAETVIKYISTMTHSKNFFVGVITLTDLVYYLSGILFCLLLTRLSIETRLWR